MQIYVADAEDYAAIDAVVVSCRSMAFSFFLTTLSLQVGAPLALMRHYR